MFRRPGVSANDLTLYCLDLPRQVVGYPLASLQSGFVPNPGGSQGNLCLGGSIGRMVDQWFMTTIIGRGIVPLDLASSAQPMGSTSVLAGDIWFFQVGHRDSGATAATSNFSNAIAVAFTD